MAIAVQVAGLATIKIDGEILGYTRNGADITKEAFFLDVPGDEHGGDDGPPIEIQYLGELCRVRLEMTKYDNTVADAVRRRCKDQTAGQPYSNGVLAGELMFGDAQYVRLTIDCPRQPRNFPVAVPRQPIELNRGTKYSTLICEFECHRNQSTGILYDANVG